ncbi:hypothetical protein O9929_12400 [Vibrio lentus]|nr:hypothetical protein [Vibrio lentus]
MTLWFTILTLAATPPSAVNSRYCTTLLMNRSDKERRSIVAATAPAAVVEL